jgi:HK97 family phage portal protein
MNRLSRWWNRQKAPAQPFAPDFLRVGVGPYTDLPGLTLPDQQASLYQRLSWVYIAVSITAQTAAGAPFSVEELVGEKTEAIDNHPFELLLRRPNPLQSRLEFLEALIGHRQLTGNAYVWLNRTSPERPPAEMWIIPSSSIEPVPDAQMYLRGYVYEAANGRKIPLETWEICHLKRFHPRNQFVGLSPLEALSVTAFGDLAMAKWNTAYFDKQNAKPAGLLAFADPINDNDWERMKRDIEAEHGGTNRKMMLLRNAGKSGVQYQQVGVSQHDMEFLAGRTFNKEEIFAAFAPGLSSMLAVNATEANSLAGRATFTEMTIWPIHQAVAEKFTSDVLPAYGPNLVGSFEDVRVTDRAMQLQEQQTSYRVLTIQEAREKYYGLPPLGDDRDGQLVEGQAVSLMVATDSERGQAITQAAPQQGPEPELPEPEVETEEPEEPVRADLIRWQRKAYKRAKAGQRAVCNFESSAIPATLAGAIGGALETAETALDVRGIFGAVLDDVWQGYP